LKNLSIVKNENVAKEFLRKVGNHLKRLRKEKGMTQVQIAKMFGISSSTISRWENQCNIPIAEMDKWLAVFGDKLVVSFEKEGSLKADRKICTKCENSYCPIKPEEKTVGLVIQHTEVPEQCPYELEHLMSTQKHNPSVDKGIQENKKKV